MAVNLYDDVIVAGIVGYLGGDRVGKASSLYFSASEDVWAVIEQNARMSQEFMDGFLHSVA